MKFNRDSRKAKRHAWYGGLLLAGLLTIVTAGTTGSVQAIGSTEPEQSGSTGLQGKISSPPPTTPATISSPPSRNSDTSTVTLAGLCTKGLIVKVFNNNIFVGAVQCTTGSYSIQVDLFSGQNEIVARVYDSLDQAGPDSNKIVVTFNDGSTSPFGQRISLTSNYAKLGAAVGTELSWPIILSGGAGPYAISIDWGDGTATDLKSQSFAGTFYINHTYKTAGIYRVIVKATDANGTAAFLQLIGVGAGAVTQSTTNSSGTSGSSKGGKTTQTIYIWWPSLLMVPIVLGMFWVGRRYELVALHRRLEKQARMYEE